MNVQKKSQKRREIAPQNQIFRAVRAIYLRTRVFSRNAEFGVKWFFCFRLDSLLLVFQLSTLQPWNLEILIPIVQLSLACLQKSVYCVYAVAAALNLIRLDTGSSAGGNESFSGLSELQEEQSLRKRRDRAGSAQDKNIYEDVAPAAEQEAAFEWIGASDGGQLVGAAASAGASKGSQQAGCRGRAFWGNMEVVLTYVNNAQWGGS
ncbi:hypothetical protein C8J57DRAFT_1467302 [Mycena rebaudengoi]|nr:hypothetical protein C8J57DRAFT_1467302 [Mycena rebaudengoi]